MSGFVNLFRVIELFTPNFVNIDTEIIHFTLSGLVEESNACKFL